MVAEPRDESICVWYQGGKPWVVMVRIDEYADERSLGERWFCADQHFTDTDRASYAYTWTQVLEMFDHLDGPWIVIQSYVGT